MHLPRLRSIAVLLAALHLTGCHKWTPVQMSPREYMEQSRSERVRITLADGSTVEVGAPTVENDSIVETQSGGRCAFGNACQVRSHPLFPVDDVTAVDIRELDVAATTLLTVTLVAVLARTVYALVQVSKWF